MSSEPLTVVGQNELDALQQDWRSLVMMGAANVVLGGVACFTPLFGSTVFLGVMLLLVGIVQMVATVWSGPWRGYWPHLLTGLVYLLLGAMACGEIGSAAGVFAALVPLGLLTAGIFRLTAALQQRFCGWYGATMHGMVSLLVGILFFAQYPLDSPTAAGLLLGLELAASGLAWIMLGREVRPEIPQAVKE